MFGSILAGGGMRGDRGGIFGKSKEKIFQINKNMVVGGEDRSICDICESTRYTSSACTPRNRGRM